jgi:hypothetical protein
MERIPVSGLITPIYESDNYPVLDPRFGIDGMRSLNTLQEMYDLPLEKRRAGMVVGIPNTSNNTVAYYKLKPEGNTITWGVGSVSNWDGFLTSVTGSNAIPVKYALDNEQIVVPQNYEYLLWGDMVVGNSASFQNDGKTYIINGNITTGGDPVGTTSGSGEWYYIYLPKKYTTTVECGPNGTQVDHNLGTTDITYSARDGNNFVQINVENLNGNSILVKSFGSFSVNLTVIG